MSLHLGRLPTLKDVMMLFAIWIKAWGQILVLRNVTATAKLKRACVLILFPFLFDFKDVEERFFGLL